MATSFLPSISLFVPAYNEGNHVIKNVTGMLTLKYFNIKLIIINDGSTDSTLSQLIDAFELVKLPPVIPGKIKTQPIRNYYISKKHSNLMVIDKENGGKADALNAALNISTDPYYVTVDADTFLDHHAFLQALYYFFKTPKCIAAGSAIGILNENKVNVDRLEKIQFPRRIILGNQTLEYMRSFFGHRGGGSSVCGNLIIPGSFSIYDRQAIAPITGYSTKTVTEDFDLSLSIHKWMKKNKVAYAIEFVPALVAWTIIPEKYKSLFYQRERWQRGMFKALWENKNLFLNPLYGRLGLLGMPFLLCESLSIFVEASCYLLIPLCIYFGVLNWQITAMLLIITFTICIISSTLTLFFEELTFKRYSRLRDLWGIVSSGFLECFGFHQIVVAARLQGYWRSLKGDVTWRHPLKKKSRSSIW